MYQKTEISTTQITETLRQEFIFLCQSYKNQYLLFPNTHTEFAERIIRVFEHFNKYSEKLIAGTEDAFNLFLLITIIKSASHCLEEKASEKFQNKISAFVDKYKLNAIFDDSLFDKNSYTSSVDFLNIFPIVAYWNSPAFKRQNSVDTSKSAFCNLRLNLIKHLRQTWSLYSTESNVVIYDVDNKCKKTVESWLNKISQTPKKMKQETLIKNIHDNLDMKVAFIKEHGKLLKKAKAEFGGIFRHTNLDYTQSFADLIRHAQDYDNRSREAFINLKFMDKEGKLILTKRESSGPGLSENNNFST
ncbi:MAG: hypothetical protein H0U70_09570 [Tatlockia sp.]|nr:hypothetical protein [Tatlockia sp.]